MTSTTSRRPRAARGEGHVLRGEIVAAARALVVEKQSFEAVSMREVADRVGVTTPAIYRHFEDKDQLVAAVCDDVFTDIDAAMAEEQARFDEPLAQLIAIATAYARFAYAHPAQYRVVMMSPKCHRLEVDEVLDVIAHRRLVAAVIRCQDSGLLAADASPLVVSLALWTAVHGMVSVMLVRPEIAEWADPVVAAELVTRTALLGIAVQERLGALGAPGAGGAAALAARLDVLGSPRPVLGALPPPPVPGLD